MGLASALTTALTGLSAAETQIDVVGNNLANSQTVGFKASDVVFATQFLQTQSLGSAPTSNDGGTNPRQTGLGVRTAEITPDFTQGTIEASSNPSDLAIQGDGFFIVEGSAGDQLYTRNGVFKTNAENQLVTVNGNRVLGFGVDENYTVQNTELVPLSVPLGEATVAQATQNVKLVGVFTPTGDVADTAEVIESTILGDGLYGRPSVTATAATAVVKPVVTAVAANAAIEGSGGNHVEGSVYKYKFAYVDDAGQESPASDEFSVTVPVGDGNPNNTIALSGLPAIPSNYASLKIYRTAAGGNTFFEKATVTSTTYNDTALANSTTQLDSTTLTGNYSYMVTFLNPSSNIETRPSELLGPVNIVNGRIQLTNLPTTGNPTGYTEVRIYRNLAADANSFHLVDTVPVGTDFYTDNTSDAVLATADAVDLNGPRVQSGTLLTDVLKRDGLNYEQAFELGTITFQGRKGGRQLGEKTFEITNTSTMGQLLEFMQDAMGIQTSSDDPLMPTSLNTIEGESGTLTAGASLTSDGKIRIVSNNGVDNALEIGLSSFVLTTSTNEVSTPSLGFASVQEATGQSAVADFIVYDTAGIALNVRVTAVLESVSDTATTYRWFADSPQNDTVAANDVIISIGTGKVTFDGEGNFISSTNSRASIQRRGVPSADPLEFALDFSGVSGLAENKATLAASRQDGSGAGRLTSFIVGEDGTIRGVFSNGVTRDLGQLQLARFASPAGLQQVGQSMYQQGVNSGLPIRGIPGENGIGKVVAGARELSNTDIGKNLIDLVLATTQYRGNSRVISTAQELLDELLNLRR